MEVPELAGVAEASIILKASPRRVFYAIETDPMFPQPIQTLRATKVWLASDLRAYAPRMAERATRRAKKF